MGVTIESTDIKEPGKYWQFRVIDETKTCKLCGKPIESGQMVYFCPICKNMVHKPCLKPYENTVNPRSFWCKHLWDESDDLFLGEVK